jgi:hypothetical protein
VEGYHSPITEHQKTGLKKYLDTMALSEINLRIFDCYYNKINIALLVNIGSYRGTLYEGEIYVNIKTSIESFFDSGKLKIGEVFEIRELISWISRADSRINFIESASAFYPAKPRVNELPRLGELLIVFDVETQSPYEEFTLLDSEAGVYDLRFDTFEFTYGRVDDWDDLIQVRLQQYIYDLDELFNPILSLLNPYIENEERLQEEIDKCTDLDMKEELELKASKWFEDNRGVILDLISNSAELRNLLLAFSKIKTFKYMSEYLALEKHRYLDKWMKEHMEEASNYLYVLNFPRIVADAYSKDEANNKDETGDFYKELYVSDQLCSVDESGDEIAYDVVRIFRTGSIEMCGYLGITYDPVKDFYILKTEVIETKPAMISENSYIVYEIYSSDMDIPLIEEDITLDES